MVYSPTHDDCRSGKDRYPSLYWAQRMAQQMSQHQRHRSYAYPCRECGGAHITSNPIPATRVTRPARRRSGHRGGVYV